MCKSHSGEMNSVAWSPDGDKLVSGSEDGTTTVCDGRTGKELFSLTGHDASLAWSQMLLWSHGSWL